MVNPFAVLGDRIAWWASDLRYSWPHHVLFVAALPKSGSQWMKAMMVRIPGYREPPLVDPRGLLQEHHIDGEVLDSIPRRGYFTVNYPVEATEGALAAIEALDLKVVVMWRDLRDQAVSRYYHILNDLSHPSGEHYRAMSREQGVSDSVSVVLDVYTRWVRDWRAAMDADPHRFHRVCYEEFRANPEAIFSSVLRFYGIDLSTWLRRNIVAEATKASRSGGDLAERLKRGYTFRRGTTGEWMTHFSRSDIERFREQAGDLLVDMGYERDLNW